jgi:16S rRNA (adenine1518-N6/adenine1519-N6)-dimethyltransferase
VPELTPLGEVVGRFGLDARKALGQHFLLDETVCARIARLPGDLAGRQVLEVGPGPGGLTRALLATPLAHLTAVELDERALAALAEVDAAFPGRLTVLRQDAMKFDGTALPMPRQVVANLPYNVGTPLLIGWLRQAGSWERMTLMFQEEVALRIVAPPRTEHYGRLAVLAQWVAHCAIGLRLPPGAFRPPPKVHSAVVVVTPHAEQPEPAPQDAAGIAEVPGLVRGAARRMRHRRRAPCRGAHRRGVRQPRAGRPGSAGRWRRTDPGCSRIRGAEIP